MNHVTIPLRTKLISTHKWECSAAAYLAARRELRRPKWCNSGTLGSGL
jgi:hypothetical protein